MRLPLQPRRSSPASGWPGVGLVQEYQMVARTRRMRFSAPTPFRSRLTPSHSNQHGDEDFSLATSVDINLAIDSSMSCSTNFAVGSYCRRGTRRTGSLVRVSPLGACELALQIREGSDDVRRLEGSVPAADGHLLQDSGLD